MNSGAFAVHSGIGRFQFGNTRAQFHSGNPSNFDLSRSREVAQENQANIKILADKIAQYKNKMKQERKAEACKLIDLQRKLRAEQARLESLEKQLVKMGPVTETNGSSYIVNQISQQMNEYYKKVQEIDEHSLSDQTSFSHDRYKSFDENSFIE